MVILYSQSTPNNQQSATYRNQADRTRLWDSGINLSVPDAWRRFKLLNNNIKPRPCCDLTRIQHIFNSGRFTAQKVAWDGRSGLLPLRLVEDGFDVTGFEGVAHQLA